MHSRNTFNKIKFGGYLYSFNSDNGGRFTSPNGGYAINGGNAGINSYGRHYDAIGLNAYSSQARYDDWAQAIRNYYNGTATLQEMNYFASMAGQDYAQITCQESILNNYHHNNSVINEMNDAIDLSLESGTTKDLFDLANGVTGYAGISSGATYEFQHMDKVFTLASLGGYELGNGQLLISDGSGGLALQEEKHGFDLIYSNETKWQQGTNGGWHGASTDVIASDWYKTTVSMLQPGQVFSTAMENWGSAHRYSNNSTDDKIIYDSNGSSDGSLVNIKSLGRNFLGSNYIGHMNPKTTTKKDSYHLQPRNRADLNAYIHDKTYDALHLKGPLDLFTASSALDADWRFVKSQMTLQTSNTLELLQARGSGVILGLIILPKTIYSVWK